MKLLNKILEILLGIVVAVMVAGCFWQVFTRFVLNSPSKYTEELLRYLLIWMTMLGVPLSGCWFKGGIYIFAMLFWEVLIWIRRRGFPQNARHG